AMGMRGDADVLLTHAPSREEEVVAGGFVVNRRAVMYNDFLIAGPPEDPAGIRDYRVGVEAVTRIAETGARFVSRGDDSGTHIMELSLWREAAVEVDDRWYVSTGQGMGATLIIAGEMGAYLLTDRGTFLALEERTGLEPLVEGDPRFLNIYSVMEVNHERFPDVNNAGAAAFSGFLLAAETQRLIEGFGVEEFGQPLFYPEAGADEEPLGQWEAEGG
ncbi:MAG: substrate-binding domain-containing protein, partial [Gemmatimonadetes bacterium]|nr:substrate-binding domain-containing protein [Gemmatimonadota bacterium]